MGFTLNETVFDLVFPSLVVGENSVLCPFHAEKTPSMQINTAQKVYHCFGCGAHGNENDFIQQYYGIGKNSIAAFREVLFKSDSIHDYEKFQRDQEALNLNPMYKYFEQDLGISRKLLEMLKVGVEVKPITDPTSGYIEFTQDTGSHRLVFPILIKDRILDRRAYQKGVLPKTKSSFGVPGGLILPFHLWEHDMSPTIICEGEKDMTVARNAGYNAISLGGANNIPTIFLEQFKDRQVYIVYDNDAAGREGARKLAAALYEVTHNVRIADIGEYATQDKEDITDFFIKYKYGPSEFNQMLEKSKLFDAAEHEDFIKKSYPKVSLNEASTTYLGKVVRSNIQVMATFEDQYSTPSYAVFKKEKAGGKDESNHRKVGDVEYWSLNKFNFEDILVLTDNNLKKPQILENLKGLIGWGTEEFVKVTMSNPKTVFKSTVADNTETIVSQEIKRTEFVCYTDEKLEAGKNYQIIYKVVPHPYQGQQQVLVVLSVKESADTINTFAVDASTIPLLKAFQKKSFKELIEMQKALIKFDVDNMLLGLIDLWYHTPATFSFGLHTSVRGYLDGLIVTESRVGKSSTAKALSEVYGVGAIASLAGSAATPAGLIGGSVKTGTSSQIRPGLIPRNHKRSIIFEELAKAKYSLIPELTDIRSSGLVRINRSTGDLTLPSSVRMLFLSNPKISNEGIARPIIAYPNGLEIIKDLIGSIEDIARFDFIYILPTESINVDPSWRPIEGFTDAQLKTRIRWVWSRKENQIVVSDEVQKYIVEVSQKYNTQYQNSTKIFSAETWKKITRLATALAGYMVSTDVEFEKIIVLKQHVDTAAGILKRIYDNDVFKLQQFTNEERKKLHSTTQDILLIKELLNKYPSVMQYLENNTSSSKNTLFTISGLDQIAFNDVLKHLSSDYFIEMSREKILPTPKLLMTLRKVRELERES